MWKGLDHRKVYLIRKTLDKMELNAFNIDDQILYKGQPTGNEIKTADMHIRLGFDTIAEIAKYVDKPPAR